MAEITSGKNLTVMILTSDREVDTVMQALHTYADVLLSSKFIKSSPHVGICQDLLDGLGWYEGCDLI